MTKKNVTDELIEIILLFFLFFTCFPYFRQSLFFRTHNINPDTFSGVNWWEKRQGSYICLHEENKPNNYDSTWLSWCFLSARCLFSMPGGGEKGATLLYPGSAWFMHGTGSLHVGLFREMTRLAIALLLPVKSNHSITNFLHCVKRNECPFARPIVRSITYLVGQTNRFKNQKRQKKATVHHWSIFSDSGFTVFWWIWN